MPTAVGVAATVVFFVGTFWVAGTGQLLGITGIYVLTANGFVAGFASGRGWVEGGLVGFRGALIGIVLLGAITSVTLFLLWRAGTGQNFFFWSPFFGAMLVLVAPLFGFAGAIGGAVGSVVRRVVVPRRYNPPLH